MASIDEMLFDAIRGINRLLPTNRSSNPPARVSNGTVGGMMSSPIEGPALDAARQLAQSVMAGSEYGGKALSGELYAGLGQGQEWVADRKGESREEQARRLQGDPFFQAWLAYQAQDGNIVQRARAANEGAASGNEFEVGLVNAILDPFNLIFIPVGKGNKVLQATRQSKKAGQLMEGVDFAGLIADRAVPGGVDSTGDVAFKKLIAGVGENGTGGLGPTIREMQGIGPLPEEVQQATTLSQLIQGAEKAGGVDGRGNVAFSDLIRGVGADGKGGLGPTLRETQPFGPSPDEIAKIMYDTSIGGRKGDVGLSQMIKGLGSDGGRGLGPALPDELLPALPPELGPTPAEVARARFNTRIGGTTGNVKKADLLQNVGDDGLGGLGPPSMPELGPSLEEAVRRRFDTSIGGEQAGGKLGSIAEKDMLLGVGVGGKRGLGPVLPKGDLGQVGLAEDLAESVGNTGTKWDRFRAATAGMTIDELPNLDAVDSFGNKNTFWKRHGLTNEEAARFTQRALDEGLFRNAPRNVDIPRNLLDEPADLAEFDDAMAALGGVQPLANQLPAGGMGKQALDAAVNLAYGGKQQFAWPALLKRIGAKVDKTGVVRVGEKNVTTEVFEYLYAMSDAKGEKAKNLLRDQLAKRIEGPSGSSMNFTVPGLNAAINLGTKALTNQATAAPLTGGLAGGAAGATTGGITGALATPEDRWGGFKQGFAGGAVLGASIGAGSFAYGLRHVTPETWSNLTKHSWELARKNVAETTANATGHSILPTPKQLISFWKNQTVSTMRQFGQDGTWNRMVTEGLQGKNAMKLAGQITQQISERMKLKGFDRLSTPVQDTLKRFGKQGYEPQLGMPIVDSVAMHGLSRSQSVVSSALLSTFGPGNAIGGLVGAAKGAAMPEFSGMIRHANGALNRGFRETAFVDELDNKLIPLAIDAFKRLGYDLSAVPVDQLTRATVEQMYGAKAGAMWQKTMENMIPMAESRVRYLFGDYTPGQKGAIGLIEKITGPGMPFSSWAIRAYPVALDMAIQNPWVALGVYQFLQATSAGAGKDGRPRWTAGKLPISTEFPLLGAGARTLLGGQKGTAYVDLGSLSPVGGDLFQPGADQEGPQSLYQQVSEIIGRAGLPGLSPIAQGIAYMLGLDYKGPGNLSRTQGMENSLGLIPGNIDIPGWGDVALRAGRAKLSPAFAGTELGAKLGATGDKYPTVYDPVARRYGELVVKATGKSLDDPKNRAYLYDLAAGTGELYDQARREVLLGGLARNAFSTTSPIGVATQGEGARTAKRDREGLPNKYEALSAEYENPPNIGMPSLAGQNKQYKQANPGAATYDVGSKEEAQSMLMDDILAQYTTIRGRQMAPRDPKAAENMAEWLRKEKERERIALAVESTKKKWWEK